MILFLFSALEMFRSLKVIGASLKVAQNHLRSLSVLTSRSCFSCAVTDSDDKLLWFTFSLQDKGTFLLVLDAKTFEELGRANVPVNMAYGFHGAFSASA